MNILIAESKSFASEAHRILDTAGRVQLADLDVKGLEARVGSADVLWVRLRHRITEQLLDRAAGLRLIACPTTGLNHIDLEGATRRGITVLSLRGEVDFLKEIRATAEHTIGLTLSLLRRLPAAVEHVRDGRWDRDLFRGSEIHGKTVGVIGYGRLGKMVARYFETFGAHVLICDPNAAHSSVPEKAELLPLSEVLRRADIVTLHTNLSTETTGLVGAAQFAMMKPGAWLINTSRGEVIDEGELVKALDSRHLAGAALDVISAEHDHRTSTLLDYAWSAKNLLITPHIGGCTNESMVKAEVFLANRVREWINNYGSASPQIN